jgi:parallel beta-helix repeat protein
MDLSRGERNLVDLLPRWTVSGISLAILALGAAGLIAFGGGQASAGINVSCGDTITADTTLDSDLVDCPNNGIVIGADGITLDLDGHLIDGDGTEFAGCAKTEPCDVGVANDGHDGVIVRDGSVREFGVGVLVGGARKNRVVNISSTRHIFFGVVVGGSSRSVIRRSSLSRNIAPEGDGIGVFDSDRIRIVRNKIRRNPGPGIHLFDSKKNLVKKNVFSRNGPAISMEKADRNKVQRNRVVRGAGIIVAPGNRNVIARNRVARAVDSLAIEKGHGNLVAGNVVVGARGAGIRLGLDRPPIGGDNTVVRENRVNRSGDDGFLVAETDDHSLLKRNVARHNGGDGFDVESDSAKLARNHAVRNGDLGIEAVAGVGDGGGNKAHGNGGPVQCTNIACM